MSLYIIERSSDLYYRHPHSLLLLFGYFLHYGGPSLQTKLNVFVSEDNLAIVTDTRLSQMKTKQNKKL